MDEQTKTTDLDMRLDELLRELQQGKTVSDLIETQARALNTDLDVLEKDIDATEEKIEALSETTGGELIKETQELEDALAEDEKEGE